MPGRIWAYLIGTNESHTDEAVSMRVSMVAVRRMQMSMPQRHVRVPMTMGLARIDRSIMRMVMMLVVGMTVLVGEFEMLVKMLMAFAEMQPDPESHQGTG